MFGLLFEEKHYYNCMKRFFTIIFIFLLIGLANLSLSVMADDVDLPATGDLWDNWNTRDEGREAKPVTDEEFDKAIQQVDKKVNKWKNWAKNRQIPKGKEFNKSNETEMIDNSYGEKQVLPVLCVPVELKVGEDTLPIGHYQVVGEKVDGQAVLKFYQSQYEMAQFPAVETTSDFGEDTISFVKWEPVNDNEIKVMYGSLDMNAYAIIEIKENE